MIFIMFKHCIRVSSGKTGHFWTKPQSICKSQKGSAQLYKINHRQVAQVAVPVVSQGEGRRVMLGVRRCLFSSIALKHKGPKCKTAIC